MTRRRQCLIWATALPFASVAQAQAQAQAQTLSADERRAVRATIEAQLQALAVGDAAGAFGFASPAIRQLFGTADNFLAMVRQSYPMVIRPAATAFFESQRVDGLVVQGVQLRDAAGGSWLATYQLQRLADQPGQPWRIHGVVVAADTGKSST